MVESWTRAFIISNDTGILPRPRYGGVGAALPLCFIKDGEVLILVNGYQLLVYNPDKMSKRDIPLSKNQDCTYIASYVGSLASTDAYGHKEDWTVQGPDASNFFFPSYTAADWDDSSIEEEDISYGYCSDKESFHSTK